MGGLWARGRGQCLGQRMWGQPREVMRRRRAQGKGYAGEGMWRGRESQAQGNTAGGGPGERMRGWWRDLAEGSLGEGGVSGGPTEGSGREGMGGGGLRWKGTGQGAPQRGAIWLSCSSELTLCRAIPKPTLSLCHCSPAILKSDTGGACVGGTCWVALCVGSPLFPSTQGT